VRTILTEDVRLAASILRRGGLVAFPTETVYGLGADATDVTAVRGIFAAKGRPTDNPLIVHVADAAEVGRIAVVTDLAALLISRFWPGPLTVVVPSRPVIPVEVRAGLPTVAVRCPDHLVARGLIRATGRPLAAPSANMSGRPSPTAAATVLEDLAGRIDAVLDGGPCRLGLESTVVDCTGPEAKILRLGALPAEAMGLVPAVDPQAAGRSPGTLHRHYAPAIPLYVVDDMRIGLRENPDAAVLCAPEEAIRLGIVPGTAAACWDETPEGRAAGLFALLRRLEKSGRRVILVSPLPKKGLDAATMDRLHRAAAAGPALDADANQAVHQKESPPDPGSFA